MARYLLRVRYERQVGLTCWRTSLEVKVFEHCNPITALSISVIYCLFWYFIFKYKQRCRSIAGSARKYTEELVAYSYVNSSRTVRGSVITTVLWRTTQCKRRTRLATCNAWTRSSEEDTQLDDDQLFLGLDRLSYRLTVAGVQFIVLREEVARVVIN